MNKFGFLSTVLLLISLFWLFSGKVTAETLDSASVSPALDVIASRINMIRSSAGAEIGFSAEDFEDALGIERLSGITVTGLPGEARGVLYLGDMEMREGQRVDRDSIGEMTFRWGEGANDAEVSFKYDGADYIFTCYVRSLRDENYAPTSLGIDESFYKLRTYKNLAVCGNMMVRDPEGDTVTFEITEYPSKGLLTVSDRKNGDYTYTPVKNYSGKDSFSYVAVDEYGNRSAEMTVSVEVCASQRGTVYNDMIGHPCHYSAVLMTDLGIMEGTENSGGRVFMPELEVSAYELISCSLQALGLSDKTDTREQRLGIAQKLGVNIMEDFIDEPITRADACVILDIILNTEECGSRRVLADGADIPSDAEDAVYTMAEMNVINVDGGFVYPKEQLTRGELAGILAALISFD